MTKNTPKQLILLTVLFCGIKFKIAELVLKEEKISKMTSQCVLNVIHTYLNESKKISVRYQHDQKQESVLKDLFKFTTAPLVVNADEHPIYIELDTRTPNDVAIILSGNINVTMYLENNLYTAETVFLTVVWEERKDIADLFIEFWKFNIVNAFALYVQYDALYVYNFVPYVNCNMIEPLLLAKCSGNRFMNGHLDRIRNRHPISDLNGCEFNVSAVDLPPTVIYPNPKSSLESYVVDGIEGRLLNTLSNVINARFLYKIPEDGKRWGFITPEPKGAIGEVYFKRSLIACGLHTPNTERFTHLEAVIGTSAVMECLTWVVPQGSAKEQPVWVLIYVSEFSIIFWICIFITFILMMISFVWIVHTHKLSVGIIDIFLLFFSSSLGMSVKTPQNNTLKALLFAWIWYVFIIIVAYDSSLKSRLTVPIRYKNIDTFRELLDSDLSLGGISNTIRVVLEGTDDPELKELGKRLRATNKTITEMAEDIVINRTIGYVTEQTTFSYIAHQNRKVKGKIHRLNQCGYMYNPTLYVQKRCPITHVVKRVVSALRESGILLWWRSLFLQDKMVSKSKLIKLSIKHMLVPFIVYGIGMLLANIIFIMELTKYYFFDKKFRRFSFK